MVHEAENSNAREVISFCRICSGGCGTKVIVDSLNRIVDVRGDQENLLSNGYACFKGLNAAEAHNDPNRILHAQKRQPDGGFRRIPIEQALDEIAEKLAGLIDTDGPTAIAGFCGNGSMSNSTAYPIQPSFLKAIGSKQYFSTLTIDQSAKMIAFGRLGGWAGGRHEINEMDVLMLFGANPLVSHAACGLLAYDPVRNLKQAKARGLKLITIDPRRTETAYFADLALQPFPGQDAAIAAGLLNIILAEAWEDSDFCARHVGSDSIAALREAVSPFEETMVERRAGLEDGQLRIAAEMFARDGRLGIAFGATGPDMAPYSNLAQHMIELLNVVCGRFPRAGEHIRRNNVQAPKIPRFEQAIPPCRTWEADAPSRIRGVGSLFGERLSGTLADEILTPGEERIRALLVAGGNPALSLPDQRKAVKALSALDLLVCIDPWMTATARLAHYILPPFLQYERPDVLFDIARANFWPSGWMQYTAAIVSPPPESECVEEFYVYWSLAKRLGKTINLEDKGEIPIDRRPTTEDILRIKLRGAQFDLEDLKTHRHGHDYGSGLGVVLPPVDLGARFDVMPQDVATELASFLTHMGEEGQRLRDGREYQFLMTTRRLRDVFNSTGTQLANVRKRTPHNPVFLNMADMADLGVTAGDLVELSTSHGRAIFLAAQDNQLRRGVVATSHGWGPLPGSNDSADAGVCVNMLIEAEHYVESINAMPHFSAVPVNIVPVG